jgi:hypothetical protein
MTNVEPLVTRLSIFLQMHPVLAVDMVASSSVQTILNNGVVSLCWLSTASALTTSNDPGTSSKVSPAGSFSIDYFE